MIQPKVIVLSGYGLNCEEETKFAFEKAGARGDIVHINDLIDKRKKISDYQILAIPGGFSYGDDTGAGNAFANRIKNHLWNDVREFVSRDKLVLDICNGFQIITNIGLLPALNEQYGDRQVALVHNESARYINRWVDLKFSDKSPWTKGLGTRSLPIAHGEGKLYAEPSVLQRLKEKDMIAARYIEGNICSTTGLSYNPNGALEDIAALTDESGKVLGMMPHPERAIFFTHLPNWPLLKEQYRRQGIELPKEGPGMQLFRNGVKYFAE